MRQIDRLAGEWVVYVPEIDGNRDDPDPMTVEIRPMTAREMREGINASVVSRNGGNVANRMASATKEAFLAHVRKVHGYAVNGKPVPDAATLYDEGEPIVVAEVEAAIQNMSRLSDGELGKLRLRCASYSAATATLSAGIVPSAVRLVSTQSAAVKATADK